MASGVRYSVFPKPESSLQRQPSRRARSSSTQRSQSSISKPTVLTVQELSNLKLDTEQEPVSSAPSAKSDVGADQKTQSSDGPLRVIDKGKGPSTKSQTEGDMKPKKPVVKVATAFPDLRAPPSPEAIGKSPAISVTDASPASVSPENGGSTRRFSRFAKDPPSNVEGDTATMPQPHKRKDSSPKPSKPTVKLATSSPDLYGPPSSVAFGKSPTGSATQSSPANTSPARSTSLKKTTLSPTKSILKNSDKNRQQHNRTDTEISKESIETANTIANTVSTADTTATNSKTHSANNSKSSSAKTTPITPASSIDSCPSPWSAAAMSAFKSDPVKYPAVPPTQSPQIPLPPLPKATPPRRSASRSTSASTAKNTTTATGAGPGPVFKSSDSQAGRPSASVWHPRGTFLRSPSESQQSQADTTNSSTAGENGPFESLFPAYNPEIPLSKQNYRPNYNPTYYPSAPRKTSAPASASITVTKPLPPDPPATPTTRTRPPLKQTASQPPPQIQQTPKEMPFFPAPPTRPTSDPAPTRARNRIRKRSPSAVTKPAHSHKPRKSNTSVSAGSIGSKKSDGTTTSTTITTTVTRTRTLGRGGKDKNDRNKDNNAAAGNVDKGKPSFDGSTVVDGGEATDTEAEELGGGKDVHQRKHVEAAAAGASAMPEQTHARHGASVALGAVAFVMGVGVEVMGGAVEGLRKKGGRKSGGGDATGSGKNSSLSRGKSVAGGGSQVAKVEKAKG
ncbi:MAG: hypothetical protein M1831_005568 [Alyxoria varia]|nr:MAG: hypothetical protein M1831_005568 [Alyxoria varia]